MKELHIESSLSLCDEVFERPIRPASLSDFYGQEPLRQRLEIAINAALQRGDTLGHSLFCGPPGLGKTTLAHIASKAMGGDLVISSGPALEKPGDLAGLLTKLKKGDFLFIDEIHRLPRHVEEYLYSAMEDFKIDILLDSGPGAQSIRLNLEPFTLFAATTRSGLLSGPLRSRFPMTLRLDYYSIAELSVIVQRSSRILGTKLDVDGANAIAARARGTPRIANNLLRWVRDYATVHSQGVAASSIVDKALTMLQIDDLGLDEMDCKILEVICHQYGGGPVGINAIAVAVGEESDTIEEVYEPFLIMKGLLRRSPRGRMATPLAYSHLSRRGVTLSESD